MNKKLNGVIGIILVCAILLVVFNAFRAGNEPYVKYTARVGTYVVSMEAEALIVRNEHVLESGITGVLEPSVAEGERVGANTRVGSVITGNIDQAKVNELNSLNREIDSLTRTLSESGVLTIPDDKVSSALDVALGNLRYAAAKNDVAGANVYAENADILTKRKKGVMTSSTATVRLGEAINRRNSLASSLGGSHKDIYATAPGLYSDNMDGLETILTVDFANNLSVEAVDSAFEKIGSTPAGMCKIVDNYRWYIAFTAPYEECADLKVGKSYRVNFKELNNTELSGYVQFISERSEDGRCAVSLCFDRYIDDFTMMRTTDVEICKEEYTGIYVPRSAVAVEGVQGVWVQNEVKEEFRSIVEVYRSDDFLLVKENAEGLGGHKNIKLFDSIILNPESSDASGNKGL